MQTTLLDAMADLKMWLAHMEILYLDLKEGSQGDITIF